jgi:hypothetical protein
MADKGMTARLALAAALLMAAPCAAQAKGLAFDAAAKDGLIVVEADPARPVLLGGSYSLEMSRYADGQLLTGTFKGGWVTLKGMGKNQADRRFFIARAAPGDYALSSLSLKGTWYACYNSDTVAYTVRPGEVTFIGRFNPIPSLREIAIMTPSVSINSRSYYVLDTPRPAITPPGALAGWNEALAGYLASEQPDVHAPVVAATLRSVSFQTGRSLFGERVCYGYFRGKPSKDPAAAGQPPATAGAPGAEQRTTTSDR